jgi:hypothetical protein
VRRGRLVAALVALVAVLWLALCALLLVGALHDARSGLDSVNAAKRLTSPSDLLAGAPVRPLESARASFDAAHSKLTSPVVAPLRLLPVAGRQLRAASALTGAASRVSAVGADSVTSARSALQETHITGTQRIALLRRLHDIADSADRRLAGVSLGPSHALVGAIRSKRDELASKLVDVRRGLGEAAVATGGLADVLSGPRRYLVLAANNSEMRAGSGSFLSAGALDISGGQLHLGELRPTGDMKLDAVGPPPAPPIDDADFAARWGFLNPNHEWRNLGSSPRFPASASLAAHMWGALGGPPVDGVLALDPVALQAFLKATGPVSVAGQRVDADNVLALLLHDQYSSLPPPAPGHFEAVQAARREQLGQIARTILDRVSNGGAIDIAALAGSLTDAARGRHLLAWSSRPADQAAWTAAGVDGTVSAASLMVAALNRGGNKLDHFLDVSSDLSIGRGGRSVLTVTLHNATPAGENVYVAGPYPGVDVAAGDYTGYLAVELPAFAGGASVDGFDKFAAAGPDGPAQVVAVPITVRRGQTVVLTVRFDLPARGSLTVEPSARVPVENWTVGRDRFTDAERRVVRWGSGAS